MNLDALMAIFAEFDVAAFLPELNTLMGWVETILRLLVMAGPLLMLALGLLYLLAPPKEANHSVGFRTYHGMGSVEAWQFTQKLAGTLYSLLGTGLTVVMSLICNGFRAMNAMTMANTAIICVVVVLPLLPATAINWIAL